MINLFLVYLIIGPLVCLIYNMLMGLINCSDHGDYERSNGYECGWISNYNSVIRYEISFYSLALIYLIFDLELVILLPVSLEIV